MSNTTIINLSALAEPQKDTSMPARMMGYLNESLARQWLSIAAFANLYASYVPPSTMPLSSCFGTFSAPIYSVGWVISQINWPLISQYKTGKMTTDHFLGELLKSFPFLAETDFSLDVKERLFNKQEKLLTLHDVSKLEELTSALIAKALLEEAWLARMQFDQATDSNLNYFFDREKDNNVYIISNSNEMDVRETMQYLRIMYPSIAWCNPNELSKLIQIPEEAWEQGIPVTTDGSIKLYLSYTHHAFKTGCADESPMKTDALLELLINKEKLDVHQVTLISQWSKDRDMGKKLNIRNILDVKTYFPQIRTDVADENTAKLA